VACATVGAFGDLVNSAIVADAFVTGAVESGAFETGAVAADGNW
jgi:hypothetical protein